MTDVVYDPLSGVLYINEVNRIRMANMVTGVVDTIGPSTFSSTKDLAYDSVNQYLYISDDSEHTIKRISVGNSYVVNVVAGVQGSAGYSGEGIATSVTLFSPNGLCVGLVGDFYIADYFNHRIRKVLSGLMSTIAGTGNSGFSGPGVSGTPNLMDIARPRDIFMDTSGNFYVISDTYSIVYKITTSSNTMTLIAGIPGESGGNGDGLPATLGTFNSPWSIAVGDNNNIYVTSKNAHSIRIIDGVTGLMSTWGTRGRYANGPVTQCQFIFPTGLNFDTSGNLYVVDSVNSNVKKIGSKLHFFVIGL